MSKRKQKRKQGKSVEGRLRFLGAHVYWPTTIVEVVASPCLLGRVAASGRVRPRPRQYFARVPCVCIDFQER